MEFMERLDQAIYNTVHNSSENGEKIKTSEFAKALSIGQQILNNKANPQSEQNKFSPHELVGLMVRAKSTRIAEAMIEEVEDQIRVKDSVIALLPALLAVSREHGDVHRAIEAAIADNRLTAREREQCCREIDEAIAAYATLRSAIASHP